MKKQNRKFTQRAASNTPPSPPRSGRGIEGEVSSPVSHHRSTTPPLQRSTPPRWERIGRIHDLLEDGAYPNATTLGRQLKLTIKTIHRDVAYMREHLGLPIAFDPARNGYHYQRAVASRPTQPISEVELFGLLVAYRTLAKYTGTRMEASLRDTFQKFMPQLESAAVIVVEDIREALTLVANTPEHAPRETLDKLWHALQGDDRASSPGTHNSLTA
jgi:predicted DNA-binding transcriptional regulator YafY